MLLLAGRPTIVLELELQSSLICFVTCLKIVLELCLFMVHWWVRNTRPVERTFESISESEDIPKLLFWWIRYHSLESSVH